MSLSLIENGYPFVFCVAVSHSDWYRGRQCWILETGDLEVRAQLALGRHMLLGRMTLCANSDVERESSRGKTNYTVEEI